MSQSFVIAGENSGKRVICVPAVKPALDQLELAAREGNYWAVVAVRDLHALSSGMMGRKNVFVKPNHAVARGNKEYFVFLPGIKATIEHMANDDYKIVDLALDLRYFEAQEDSRPGLYEATKNNGRWLAEGTEQGQIGGGSNRLVAICDGNHKSASAAAQEAAGRIVNAPSAAKGNRFDGEGFDLHYSGNKLSMGGLRKYNAMNNSDIHGSARLLADSMYKAKNIQGVSWISEYGGSAVLTQAMKLLADRGVRLSGHRAFLYRPTTSPNEVLRLADKLEFSIDSKFSDLKLLDAVGEMSSIKSIPTRLKNPNDSFGLFDAAKQGLVGTLKLSTAVGLVSSAAVYGLTALGAGAAAANTMGAILGTGKIGASVTGGVGFGATAYKVGQEASERRFRLDRFK